MGQPFLKEGERLDDLQLAGLSIIQKIDGFRFGIDSVLLSNYVKVGKGSRIADLGTGTGIIPLLLSAKTKASKIIGIEIQKEMAEMATRSVEYNKLQDRIEIVEGDFLKAIDRFGYNSFDAIVTNPPYTKPGGGLINPKDSKAVSRHEIYCTLEQLISVSSRLLKGNGRFFMIHRPERLVDIFYYMRQNAIEPKSIRFVHPSAGKCANMVLVYGLKNGNPQVNVEEPLYLYKDLWKLLVDKKMSKAELRKATGVSPNTVTKMNKDEEVTLTVLGKICKELHCDYGDIVSYVPNEEQINA